MDEVTPREVWETSEGGKMYSSAYCLIYVNEKQLEYNFDTLKLIPQKWKDEILIDNLVYITIYGKIEN